MAHQDKVALLLAPGVPQHWSWVMAEGQHPDLPLSPQVVTTSTDLTKCQGCHWLSLMESGVHPKSLLSLPRGEEGAAREEEQILFGTVPGWQPRARFRARDIPEWEPQGEWGRQGRGKTGVWGESSSARRRQAWAELSCNTQLLWAGLRALEDKAKETGPVC